jgi:molecular chaperone HscB
MNYFEFYKLPVHYKIDQKNLRRLFLQKSKEFHPDYHGMDSKLDQAAVLEKSSFNNEAYKVLKEDLSRLKYILELNHLIGEKSNNNLPQTFLMEMMDINEQVMDLQFDYNAQQHQLLLDAISLKEADFRKNAGKALQNFHEDTSSSEDLKIMLEFYLKNRYIRRLRKNTEKLNQG